MIKNVKKLQELEDKFIRESHLSYEHSIKIYESMWKEVLILGIIKPENYLDEIEKDINLAKILNKCI